MDDAGTVTTIVLTVAAGDVTVSATAFDVIEPAEAVIEAVPAFCPLTIPFDETIATVGSVEIHVKLSPESVSPDASRATADIGNEVDVMSCVVGALTATRAGATLFMGGGGAEAGSVSFAPPTSQPPAMHITSNAANGTRFAWNVRRSGMSAFVFIVCFSNVECSRIEER
jgi:hypothetical protein